MMHTNSFPRKFVAYTHVARPVEPKKISKTIIRYGPFILTIIIFSAMILDVVTTKLALLSPGSYEGNPVMNLMVGNTSIMLSVKFGYLLLIVWMYQHFKGYEKWTILPFAACLGIHLLAIINNIIVIL
jgi:hypothetical protein